MESIYGYWIGKNEVIEIKDIMQHESIAFDVILKGKKPKKYSIYSVVMRIGYMRVVNNSDDSFYVDSVEYWKGVKLSKLQKEFKQDSLYIYERQKYYLLDD